MRTQNFSFTTQYICRCEMDSVNLIPLTPRLLQLQERPPAVHLICSKKLDQCVKTKKFGFMLMLRMQASIILVYNLTLSFNFFKIHLREQKFSWLTSQLRWLSSHGNKKFTSHEYHLKTLCQVGGLPLNFTLLKDTLSTFLPLICVYIRKCFVKISGCYEILFFSGKILWTSKF